MKLMEIKIRTKEETRIKLKKNGLVKYAGKNLINHTSN